jgi:hypothetical protein
MTCQLGTGYRWNGWRHTVEAAPTSATNSQ